MIAPTAREFIRNFAQKARLEAHVVIDDVERLTIERENTALPTARSWLRPNASALENPLLASFFQKRMRDDAFTSTNRAVYPFGERVKFNRKNDLSFLNAAVFRRLSIV